MKTSRRRRSSPERLEEIYDRMPSEPTTIASVVQAIAEVLRTHYNVDPDPLLGKAGLDPSLMGVPDARYPRSRIMKLWKLAAAATGDPCIGLTVGFHIRTTSFHALGFSWLASDTLLDAFHRLARYYRVIATVPLRIEISESVNGYTLEVIYPDPNYPAPPIALDSFMASIIQLCRTATEDQFHPRRVRLCHDDRGHADRYIEGYGCPVEFGTDANAFDFDTASLRAQLPGDNLAVVRANDRVVEQYLNALDPHQVRTDVEKLLVELLPTGEINQETIAGRLHKSLSTLRRQLSAEGASFREIREELRQRLAEDYVREGNYSLSQVAYLLGFSDQSNFSRAFKRWHGATPSEYSARIKQTLDPQ